jgi:hypothetical protein
MFFKSWQKGMKEENANWSSMVSSESNDSLPITPNFSGQLTYNGLFSVLAQKKTYTHFHSKTPSSLNHHLRVLRHKAVDRKN